MSDSLFCRLTNVLTNVSACAKVGDLKYYLDTYSEYEKPILCQTPYANGTVGFLALTTLFAASTAYNGFNAVKNGTSVLAAIADSTVRGYALPMIVRAGAEIISNTTGLSADTLNMPAQIGAQILYTKAKNAYNYFLILAAEQDLTDRVDPCLIGNRKSKLMSAAYKGKINTVQAFIQAGANLDLQNHYGETALMLAAEYGRTDIVKILIQAGANINLINKQGKSALALANTDWAKKNKDEVTFAILSSMSFQQVTTELQNNPSLRDVVNQFRQKENEDAIKGTSLTPNNFVNFSPRNSLTWLAAKVVASNNSIEALSQANAPSGIIDIVEAARKYVP